MNEEYEAMPTDIQEQVPPDINSFSFDDNEVDAIDEAASFTDTLPPPLPGKYQLKLSNVEGSADGKEKQEDTNLFPSRNVSWFEYPAGSKHYVIALDLQLLDQQGNNVGRSQREWINTMVDRERKTSAVATYVSRLGISVKGKGRKELVKALHDAIAGGRDTIHSVETEWMLEEAEGHTYLNKAGQEKTKRTAYKKSMRQFPSVVIGNETVYKPLDADPETGKAAVTKWWIKKI